MLWGLLIFEEDPCFIMPSGKCMHMLGVRCSPSRRIEFIQSFPRWRSSPSSFFRFWLRGWNVAGGESHAIFMACNNAKFTSLRLAATDFLRARTHRQSKGFPQRAVLSYFIIHLERRRRMKQNKNKIQSKLSVYKTYYDTQWEKVERAALKNWNKTN